MRHFDFVDFALTAFIWTVGVLTAATIAICIVGYAYGSVAGTPVCNGHVQFICKA